MKYNKSEIMKNAWNYFKAGKASNFSVALKLSWLEAKTVAASELSVGDTIENEYGDYGNMVKCLVTSVSTELFMGKYLVINALAGNIDVEFCIKPNDRITRLATAVIELAVAA